ncbi:MAG: response regulator, partial [Gemmatimonadales bacterium]|nr:response regulator [Gemmatimonadales bacterium]
TARVLQEGGQLILREAGQPSDALIPFGDTGRLSASLIFVPIRHSDRINGVLSIQSYTPQAYDRSDLDTVQALADHCGGALERLRIEEALRESQAQLARTEAVSLVMTAHVGLDDRWLKVPPMLCRLLDYGEEELLRMRLDDVIHPEDLESGATQRRRLVQGEARSFDLEMRCLTRAGRTIWMYLNCSVVQDVHGRPLYFLAYLRDITDRKSLEDQLRQAQKMEAVGQLAGGIAHDFNNLLTAILGHGELLLAEIGPEDPRRADVTEITRAAHRAAALTRQLLAFSRKQVLQPRVINLNAVVNDLAAMLRRIIGEHVSLELLPDSSLGYVYADAGQLEQVITNLIVNARDAMPQGGTLTLRTANVHRHESPDWEGRDHLVGGALVALSVTDTGIGMDDWILAHLFEPFFTTKELGRGTGLGLATVYGIVRQSGGQIQVRSQLNVGSTFTVYLPQVQGADLPGAQTETPGNSPGGPETILVVEDEESVRTLTCRVLRAKGYRVLEAPTAQAALDFLRDDSEKIDLLLTDVVMPQIGGPALAERCVREQPGLRVLYMSGYAEEAIERQAALTGGSSLLEKPFTADQLARGVREALSAGSR